VFIVKCHLNCPVFTYSKFIEHVFSKAISLRLDVFFMVSCSRAYVRLAVNYIKFVIIVIFDLQILPLHVGLM